MGSQLRNLCVAGLIATLLFAATAAGDSAPLFSAPQLVAEASGVGGMTELATGDLNGDGLADAVVTRVTYPPAYETHPVGVFLADGHGGFSDGTSLFTGSVPRTEHGRQIVIADFNGDHRNDIFVADHGYDADPWPGYPNTLALSTPAGKLVDASGNLPPESGFSHSATAADIDADGDLDIFVGNLCCSPPPEILLNDGTGHFTLATGRLPADVTSGSNSYTRSLFVDVNKDGSPDLVLGANGDTTDASRVLLNDGHGTFHDGTPLPAKPWGPTAILISIATLDLNADGYPDLIAGFTQSNPFYVGRRIQVLVNAGDGTFRDETATRLPVQSDGSGWPRDIRVADVNGDGHADFGVASNWPDRPALYVDDGTGVFHMYDLPQTESEFAFVDANGDGLPDLFSSSPGSATWIERHFVQLQMTASPPPPPPPPPPPVVVPKPPTGVEASRGLRGRIRVRWSAASGAIRYEVWRARPHARRARIGRTAATRYDDRRARRRVKYTYWIRAANTAGRSGFSRPATGRRR